MVEETFEAPHPMVSFSSCQEKRKILARKEKSPEEMSLKNIKRSFQQVTVDDLKQINIEEFLEATESLVGILESLGTAFTPVKNDMMGNITVDFI